MQENKKILAIISISMLAFLVVVVSIVVVNFREYSLAKESSLATVVASLVKDGLTAHMASNTMSQRELFLDNAKKSSGANNIWIFRTNKVVKLFGQGFLNETIRDAIDRKVIATKKEQVVIDENFVHPTLRVTIPYIATANSNPNCLKCHTDAKEGDVLGGISMVFDLEAARASSIVSILKIFGVALIFIVFFIYIVNKLLKPYTGALIAIKESLKKANRGDYLTRIKINDKTKSAEVFRWLNTLLEKLEKTIGAIDKNISLFVADRRQEFHDPLEKSQAIIEDIAMIYRFKRTIEQDISKEVIYKRLIKIFKEQLKINDLSLFEVDIKSDKRVLIYHDTPENNCAIADSKVSQRCRAYRTNSVVSSDDFENICQSCSTSKEYLCINYPIDENVSLVINIKPKDQAELFENKKSIGYIKNYLESARPVLQSKILTEILQHSNMIDGLTQLHNRKYLDIFMETDIREYTSYSIAMLDIDYFKKVNDSFGHDAGDRVLKSLSEIFKKNIKKEDIAFRFGGEEFLIFMPESDSAYGTIQKIKDEFEKTVFDMGDVSFNKTLSAGISCHLDDALSVWQVIKNADIALYDAKHNGRNKIVFFEDIKEKDQ